MNFSKYSAALTIMVLYGCQTLSHLSGDEPFSSESEFRSWFAFYYKDPSPERLPAALDYMETHSYLKDYPDIASVFVAPILAANPDRLAAWTEAWQTRSTESWNVILVSLWLADTPASKALMQENLHRAAADQKQRFASLVTRNPKEADLLTVDVEDPRHINLLWAAFSATGDERYVRKVISYIHLYGGEEGMLANVIGEAALMTLANNVAIHDRVEHICRDENRANPNPRTRVLLTTMFKVLVQLESKRAAGAKPAH